ncbi:prephenate dehydrogenase/arogenate dehydrogenase family protein [Patescibacteria group bacterium]|nr:prephenate dehydrogenase/arogenate dehydrogenase family protein [Patescibacteria group bacterium]MBU4367395.1 prephenate dehydrogenase/arogenate dehydrogenase family protein [Patescibacteria group bacterium]MBU4461716.1 prephenate dehydrogenase/arogenate dehydrogenase family protein [Patescibacteria group bacterium]MCG2700099.1 prephenate dehydrogenase/arogenate dehydrogenase family protein [Candidatus Parcubacteria bacterium]
MKIGIIGFGRFGHLLARILPKEHNIKVTDKQNKLNIAKEIGVNFCNIDEVCRQEIIVLCIPISEVESVLLKIQDKIKKGQIIMDICSVKEYSAKLMLKHLDKDVEIISCHPMFGPDSAKKGLKGLQIVFYNLRAAKKNFEKIKKIFKKLGLKIIEMSPKEHDRQNAMSLALVYFIGRAFANMDIPKLDITTMTFEKLREIGRIVSNDSEQLFYDMQNRNRFTKEVRKQFIKKAIEIDKKLSTLKNK